MDENLQHTWAERTVRAVNHIFPSIGYLSLSSHNQRYLPHAQLSAKLVTQWTMTFPEAVNLLHKLGHTFVRITRYEKEKNRQNLSCCEPSRSMSNNGARSVSQ